MSSTANFKVDPRLASILGDSYTSSEHALKELIDNSRDAEAGKVEVTAPKLLTDSPICVQDSGMKTKFKSYRSATATTETKLKRLLKLLVSISRVQTNILPSCIDFSKTALSCKSKSHHINSTAILAFIHINILI